MKRPRITRYLVVFSFCSLMVPAFVQGADRPPATQLLPDTTLALVRVESVPELRSRFRQTALGRITGDAKVKPLVSQLYGSLSEFYKQVEERVGLPLDNLLNLLQGELWVAIVAPEEGRPELAALLEVGDRMPDAEKLLERIELEMGTRGANRSQERVEDTDLTIFAPPGDRSRRLVLFQKQSAVVICSNVDLAKYLLGVWNGSLKVATIANDRRFTTIMNRCRGTEPDGPQVTWYVDPVGMARRAARGNLATQAGLATITALGLDGLTAAGGGFTFATGEFDGVAHSHLLLKSPRDGVVKMIAVDSGDATPERWVPRDVASYVTLYWNVRQTYDELKRLYGLFRGENAWENDILRRAKERPPNIDIESEVVGALTGRATYITWIEKPTRINSQTNLVAIHLKDAAAARQTVERLIGRAKDRMEPQNYGGVSYYRLPMPQARRDFDGETLRRPEPCLSIFDDCLVLTDSEKLLQQVIVSKADPTQSLCEELDYKLIASKLTGQLQGVKPGMLSFNRPEESMRFLYELANAPNLRTRLRDGAQRNPGLRALNDALEKNPLPPFAVIAQYLAPGGAVVSNDETGIHYMAFTLRRE